MNPCLKCEPNDTCPRMCIGLDKKYPKVIITTDGTPEAIKFVQDALMSSPIKKSVDLQDLLNIENLLEEAANPVVLFCDSLNVMREDAMEISRKKTLEALRIVRKYSMAAGE